MEMQSKPMYVVATISDEGGDFIYNEDHLRSFIRELILEEGLEESDILIFEVGDQMYVESAFNVVVKKLTNE